MSDETTNPAVETPELTDETNDVIGQVTLVPDFPPVALKATSRSKRNSEEKYTLLRLQIDPATLLDLLAAKLNAGGNHVLEGAIIREIINPACNEATSVALTINAESGETEFDADKFVETFWDSFVPSDRRRGGGVTVKDLRERLSSIMPEFTKAVQENSKQEAAYMLALEQAVKNRTAPPNKSEYVREEDLNRVAQLLLEVNTLTAQIEAKSRPGGGRPKGKSKKAKAKSAA